MESHQRQHALVPSLALALEIDERLLRIGRHQFDANFVADVEPFVVTDDHALSRRMNRAHERALLVRACDDRVKRLANAIAQQQRRDDLPNVALHLVLGVLTLGALLGDRRQLVVAVRQPAYSPTSLSRAAA